MNPEPRAGLSFPVVGVGAFAGGLEALDALLSEQSLDTRMTFVIVQDGALRAEGVTIETLQRATDRPVLWIKDNVPIEPGRVYLARSGYRVTLADGHLRLEAPSTARGPAQWPIDDFFRSLALEQGERAIMIVLSGGGLSGLSGAQAVKAAGGICIAQASDSMSHRGKADSITYFRYADEVWKPAQIPVALSRVADHLFRQPHSTSYASCCWTDLSHAERAQLTELFAMLRARTGHDLSGYKPPLLLLRIQRRMRLAGADTFSDYASVLKERPEEAVALISDLMININGFFRGPEAWEDLRVSVIRPLLAGHPSSVLRAWVVGCATGEEAYSLAIVLNEEIEAAHRQDIEVKIFATERLEAPLAFARAGLYPVGIEADVSRERLNRFFEKNADTYRIGRRLREQLIFASHNLLYDPPFSHLHLCTCRNLLASLEPGSQRRVLNLFQLALREGGHLFLGDVDPPPATLAEGFDATHGGWPVFRRDSSMPPSVTALRAQPSLPFEVRRSIQVSPQVTRAPATLMQPKIPVKQFGPPTLVADRHDRQAAARSPQSQTDVSARHECENALEEELRRVRRELQNTIEAYEAGNAQLKETVEEISSVNEELQSTNEELEAGKHALQSLNDELLTDNGQLRAQLLEVESGSNEMLNLLTSASIAVVFLDTQLNIRRFTPAVGELLLMIPGDVGHPLERLSTQFDTADLLTEARAVLDQGVSKEAQVRSHSGHWYLRRTALHRAGEDHIDGLVISFTAVCARGAAQELGHS